jgi:pilus assembly protein Flp/PilA
MTAYYAGLAWLTNAMDRVRSEEEGQTMIEYALIAFLVSIAAILILTTVGGNVKSVFTSVSNALTGTT